MFFGATVRGFPGGGGDLACDKDASDGDLLLRFVRVEELLQAVYHAPFATISVVHGPCYGAAADLVAVYDRRIVIASARFRMPGSRFGLILGTRRLANIVEHVAACRLLLREKPFGADEALAAGFIDEILPEDDQDIADDAFLSHANAVPPETFVAYSARTKYDTRSKDLSAFVKFVTASSIQTRHILFR